MAFFLWPAHSLLSRGEGPLMMSCAGCPTSTTIRKGSEHLGRDAVEALSWQLKSWTRCSNVRPLLPIKTGPRLPFLGQVEVLMFCQLLVSGALDPTQTGGSTGRFSGFDCLGLAVHCVARRTDMRPQTNGWPSKVWTSTWCKDQELRQRPETNMHVYIYIHSYNV